jgi:hypothetical protein
MQISEKPLKPKSCPSCSKQLNDGSFSFDDDLSMICGFCGHMVFSIKETKSQICKMGKLGDLKPTKP